MEILQDPNVGYVLIITAALFALAAIVVPGTGLAEIGLLFCLGLAGYVVYFLGINGWAVLVVLLSAVPFVLAVQLKKFRLPLLAASILLLIGGSVFLFVDEQGWPAVNPLLAGVVSILSGGFIWIAVERVLAAQQALPSNNPDALVGQIGEARSEIQAEGSVQVGGELWSARSEKPIATGRPVRVLQRDGFVLIIEEISK